MFFVKFLVSIVLTLSLLVTSVGTFISGKSVVSIRINTSELSPDEITNIVSNVNYWDMGKIFYGAQKNEKYDVFKFSEYVQLMQCTGGTDKRDLFKDPYDTSTFTDYDFTRLIENCRGILNLGAKPHLKLGSVPLKFTTDYEIGGMDNNIFPPDDYEAYYGYIKAIAQALVDEFGLEEVKTWRFGCMTEFENSDWFMSKSKTSEDSATAFCKLYDYTVQALIDVIGNDVFVGTHAMCVTEGLWDEEFFIKHIATGINYATGETGTHIDFFAASFYDTRPGKYTDGKTLPEMFADIQVEFKKYGLNHLIYGVDEGRLLFGTASGKEKADLLNRTVGQTWQAAYDARLYKQATESGVDYLSSWNFLSDGINLTGYPIVSYHVADNITRFASSKTAKTTVTRLNFPKVEADCLSGWNEDTQTLRIMAYNFKNDINYSREMRFKFKINVPQLDGKEVTVVKYLINDDCNFFDEWQEDRETYNITDDCFNWSPDDPTLDGSAISNADAQNTYKTLLRDKYVECSRLTPVVSTVKVENGEINIDETIGASNVLFYEIY